MKKNLKNAALLGIALATGLLATPKTSTANQATPQAQEQKAARIDEKTNRKTSKVHNHHSGLDVVSILPNYGLSPKEYGLHNGNGKSNIGKSNRNRLTHNAKLKRR